MSTGRSPLAARAEVMKLAQLLGLTVDELGYLDELPVADLRRLREGITEALFSAGAPLLGRLATASRLLPTGVLARIGEHVFGPVLSARIAGLLEPERATDVASKLPTAFLAETAVYLDPRRAADMLARIPPERIAEVTRELVRAGHWMILAGFVGHLSNEAIRLAQREMDDLTVLRVASVLEDMTAIDRLLGLLELERVDTLLDAARESELWPEVLELAAHVREPLRGRVLGDRASPSA